MNYETSTIREIDWPLVWEVKRDICFLYHEQSEYEGIDGDLDYGGMYKLPYWDFICAKLPEMRKEDEQFVRNGCLVFVLAMAMDLIDGSGTYLREHVVGCRQILAVFKSDNENTKRLADVVKLAFDVVRDPTRELELWDNLSWVNKTFVYGYFEEMSRICKCH